MHQTDSETFYSEYTSQEALAKYTRATAGYGINYLLDHDYQAAYDQALRLLPEATRRQGIRVLEFGCGGGMNLIHLLSKADGSTLRIEMAYGTDFSPVLIEAARRDAGNYLTGEKKRSVEFHVARSEALIQDLAAASGTDPASLKNSFHFVLGVNTIRYCHHFKTEKECVAQIWDLLEPGGVCVVIDMNNRFLFFKSALKHRVGIQKEEECYIPSLEEYRAPFVKAGFEVLRSEHFCWVPHSAGPLLCRVMRAASPVLNVLAKSRAMRSLVVLRKPATAGSR